MTALKTASTHIAYFSMEVGIDINLPTYSGGLGILAGDTIRSAADCEVPAVAVSLLHRKGYFDQMIDPEKGQSEKDVEWNVDKLLKEHSQKVTVEVAGKTVALKAWTYDAVGVTGHIVPVIFLDADLEENDAESRSLTNHLYGGDGRYRLSQEIILGIGGVKMLRELGYNSINRFHMNEGHAALLTVELLKEQCALNGNKTVTSKEVNAVKDICMFTTHTPVPAGHDRFDMALINELLGEMTWLDTNDNSGRAILEAATQSSINAGEMPKDDALFNMTYLSLSLSSYVNGVAEKHGEVSREMFPDYEIDSITNGIHLKSWSSEAMQSLFSKYIPNWEKDNYKLRNVLRIPQEDLWNSHIESKRELFKYVKEHNNIDLKEDVLTIGFARRFATYKRADLFFTDLEKIKTIAAKHGGIQIIFAGKAHPKDEGGKALIKRILECQAELAPDLQVVFIENYNMTTGRLITSGVDIWLNNPLRPMEASGTSGMKAALNGVPNFSVLDGWWIEGCVEGVTGWAIGDEEKITSEDEARAKDAASLYAKLDNIIAPMYYKDKEKFIEIMQHTIALNAPFFNTQRMMEQYVLKGYLV